MKNKGRFYLSYEIENGDEYSVSRDMICSSDYILITDQGKATMLAQAANALLRNMGISEDVQLRVYVNNQSSPWLNAYTAAGCCTSSVNE